MTERKCGLCREPGHTKRTCPGYTTPEPEYAGPDPVSCRHDFEYADDNNGHEGSFCRHCGLEEPVQERAWERPTAANVAMPKPTPADPGAGLLNVLRAQAETAVSVAPATVAPMADTFTSPVPVVDEFTAPAVQVQELTVNGEPEAPRDRYGRYLMTNPTTGEYDPKNGFTRATTFAKTLSDTFGLNQWGKRMVIKGLTLRPDLLDLAQGLDPRADKGKLDSIAEQAAEHAGNKIAANQGTAFHTVTERLDAGLMELSEVPARQLPEAQAYVAQMRAHKLTTRRGWIERSTLTDRGGEMVAGTFDRILTEADGQHVIGDVKSGRDLSYGWGEIAVQLLTYALGVNQFGVYNRVTKEWEWGPEVSEEYAIVMHVPVQRDDGRPAFCDLYRVDLTEALHAMRAASWVRRWRKSHRTLARPYSAPSVTSPPRNWEAEFTSVPTPLDANDLWREAMREGVDTEELARLIVLAKAHLSSLDARA